MDTTKAEVLGYCVKFLFKELKRAYKEGSPTEVWISFYRWDNGNFTMMCQNRMKLPRKVDHEL